MKTEKVKALKEEVEGWLNFNKNRTPLDLLDLSQLVTLFKRYYTLKEKK